MLGKTFESDDYVTKGCYHYEEGTYKDKIYYGTGGKLEANKKDPSKPGQSRPAGIDCKTSNQQWIQILHSKIELNKFQLSNPSLMISIFVFQNVKKTLTVTSFIRHARKEPAKVRYMYLYHYQIKLYNVIKEYYLLIYLLIEKLSIYFRTGSTTETSTTQTTSDNDAGT